MRDLRGSLRKNFVDDGARAAIVGLDLIFGRPVRRLVLGSFSNRRIDAELKQMVDLRMEGRDVLGVAQNRVPIERFQMAQVEDEPVPFRDRPRIQSAGLQQLEYFVGARSRRLDFLEEMSTDSGCSHAITD